METIVKVNNRTSNVYTTSMDIHTFVFNKDKGFFLNGKHYKLKGMYLHQDACNLLICSMDLQHQQDYPEARHMYHSLLKYMESSAFNPQ